MGSLPNTVQVNKQLKFPVNWRGERREFLEKLNPSSFPVHVNIFVISELCEKERWQTNTSKATVETTSNRLAPFFSFWSSVLYSRSGIHTCRPVKTGWIIFYPFNRSAKYGIGEKGEGEMHLWATATSKNKQLVGLGVFQLMSSWIGMLEYKSCLGSPSPASYLRVASAKCFKVRWRNLLPIKHKTI